MSTTLLEKTRAAHEDIELFEKGACDALIDDPKSHRDNVNQAHWMNAFSEKIQTRTAMLAEIYEDKTGSRKQEIQDMAGKGPQLFANFNEQLKELRAYHTRFPYLTIERPEAEQMLNNLPTYDTLFSGEEGYGKYLDLHPFYQRYLNLKGVDKAEIKALPSNPHQYFIQAQTLHLNEKPTEYIDYLDRFSSFPERSIVRDKVYMDYLKDLFNYLINYFRRSQPLFDIDSQLKVFEKDFEESWASGQFVPVGYNDIDRTREETGLWCKVGQKMFANQTAYEGYLKGKQFKKAQHWHQTVYKEMCFYEVKINRLAGFLESEIENTKDHLAAKFSRTGTEIEEEASEDSKIQSDSEDEEEVRMTKENYPVGWDGNPIPYWLYKLHGLALEFKCEICGNMSYWGPRAFEKHFQEWRHAHGMKCLRLENTKEFHHVTKIKDALELNKRLEELKVKDLWIEDEMEECEDYDGNIMNRKTFSDLKAQGLIS